MKGTGLRDSWELRQTAVARSDWASAVTRDSDGATAQVDSAPQDHPRAADPVRVPDHELLRMVGHGAYGEVWLARNALGTLRAVKVIRLRDTTDCRPSEREFHGIQKYEPVSRGHEGLVDILQVGRNDDEGYFYYVMELADRVEDGRLTGSSSSSSVDYVPRTLRHELKSRHRLPAEECLEIGLAIAGALEHLHGARLVHRDIKPSNIIFVGGRAKLADIGLVTDIGDAWSIVGTEGYLPPEGCGTPEADLYSLGKVLYEMSTGLDRRRFPELPEEATAPAEALLLRELNEIVVKACARDPARRHPTATALRRELGRVRSGRSIRRQRGWEHVRRRLHLWVPAASVLALGIVFWWGMSNRRLSDPLARTPEVASIFVLPFRPTNPEGTLSGGVSHQRVTDAFVDALASIEGVRRSPRRMGWRALDEDLVRQSLARTSTMHHVLSARLDEQAGELNLRLRLHERTGDRLVWEEALTGPASNVVGLEQRALENLLGVLDIRPTAVERERIARVLVDNAAAGRLVAEGWATFESNCLIPSGYTRVIALAEQARRLDPRYLDARYQQICMFREMALFSRPPVEIWPELQRELTDLLREDETCAGALNHLAGCLLFGDWDWEGFDACYQRQLPLERPPVQHLIRAFWLRMHGDLERARQELALGERVESSDIITRFHGATARWVHRDYDDGIRFGRRTLELVPDATWPYFCLAQLYVARGDYEEGLRAIERVERDVSLQGLTALRGCALAAMGRTSEAREILQELLDHKRTMPYLQPYFVARLYAALGETETALDWLEEAERDRSEYLVMADFGGLRTDPAWDTFQGHHRFQALLKKVGLETWPVPIRPLP